MECTTNFNRIRNNLQTLKLNEMDIHLSEYLDKLQSGDIDVTELIYELTKLEVEAKEIRAMNACVKIANFPFIKTMDDFDFSFQPTLNRDMIRGFTDLRFIEQKENILFIGSPGVGKTHLSVAIGVETARHRNSTYFIHCNDMILQLKRARLENRLEQRLKFFAKYKLLIIDEVGFLPLDDEASKLFFQLISRRYENHSTIITTNKSLSQWGEIFGDSVLANAILDRLLHHCHLVKIIGKSYRTKDLTKELNDSSEDGV